MASDALEKRRRDTSGSGTARRMGRCKTRAGSALSEDQDPSVGARRLGSWADFLCPAKQGSVTTPRFPVFRHRLLGVVRWRAYQGIRLSSAALQAIPYAVYYKVDEDVCVVFRVLDCRQEPEKTAEALK